MSEIAKYEAYKKKLQGVCDENELVFRFRNDKYPLTLTIRPVGGIGHQVSMLEGVEEQGYISPEASIVFAYKDGVLTYKTSETFTISDVLFSKIKNLYKNMHAMWLQFFNREVIEKQLLTGDDLPKASEENSSKLADELKVDYIGEIETFETCDDDLANDEESLPDDEDELGYEYDEGESHAEA